MPDYMVGIDIGSYKISATLSNENERGEFQILHSICKPSNGVCKGIVTDINSLAVVIKECLNELSQISNINFKDVSVGIGTYRSRVITKKGVLYINNTNNVITKEHINNIIQDVSQVELTEDECLVECIVNSFYTEEQGFMDNPINLKTEKLEINADIVISNKEQINAIKDAIIIAGYNVKNFTLRINSLKKMFLGEKTVSSKVLLVDVGGEKTEVAFYRYNELVALSYLPLGGDNISKDISICASLPKIEAENIKKIYGSSFIKKKNELESFKASSCEIDNKLFYDIVMARIEEIINFIYEDIKNTGFFDEINSIILIGDGINYFEGVKELVEEKINKKAIIITKYDLDLQNSSIISSIGIVKDVYDKVKLLCNEPVFFDKRISNNHQTEDNTIKKKKTYFTKIKGFLEDIF